MKVVYRRIRFLAFAFFIASLICGCASGRINQFKNFAEAGIAYSDSIVTLTKSSGETAVDADSLILIHRRKDLSPEERGKTIIDRNKLLKERFAVLGDLRRHAQLLRSYFVSLAALAGSSAPSDIGTSTEQMVSAIETLGSDIRKKQEINGESNAQMSGGAAKVIVAHFQNAALEKELRKRAKIIEKEIDLQQAVLEALAAQIKTDIQIALNRQETNEIVDPFRDPKDELSKDWASQRREILLSSLSLSAIDAASDAAKNLKTAFVALIENRFTQTDYQSLVKDMNEIIDLIEKTQSKDKK